MLSLQPSLFVKLEDETLVFELRVGAWVAEEGYWQARHFFPQRKTRPIPSRSLRSWYNSVVSL